MATMEAIVINSDSEDEKHTQKFEHKSKSSSACRTCKGICGSPDSMPMLPPIASSTSTSPVDLLFSRSRLRAPKKPSQTLVELFPVLEKVNREIRALIGKEQSEGTIMCLIQNYIRTMRKLQEQVQKYPNKCRALSRNVCRTLLLIRRMSTNVVEQTPYYIQKICELLAIYMFLELRAASSFAEPKSKIVERIVNNILLHLETPDITYILRIFAYIPFVGKEAYIVSRVFQRLIPITVTEGKNEFNDRLYVQYLIAFYHWKDSETLPNCQENVMALANAFMKPKRTLKSSIVYARHLPCYERREHATRYFLTNLVFFNDLRNASLLDGVAVMADDTIDLSDEVELLCTDYSEIELNKPEQPKDVVKKESVLRLLGTVDLTDEDETPWLTSLARTARNCEVKGINVQRKATPEIIELDSSDDESWAVENKTNNIAEQKFLANEGEAIIESDENTRTSHRTCSSIEMFLDLPEDSTSDVLLRAAISEHKNGCTTRTEGTMASEAVQTTEARITFEGIMEQEFNSLQLSSSTANTSNSVLSLSEPASNTVSENISEDPKSNACAGTSMACTIASQSTQSSSNASVTTGTSTSLNATLAASTSESFNASKSTTTSTAASSVASTSTATSVIGSLTESPCTKTNPSASSSANTNTSTSTSENTSTSANTDTRTSESLSASTSTSTSETLNASTSESLSANTSLDASEILSVSTNETEMRSSESDKSAIPDPEISERMVGETETETEKEAKGRAIVADILTNFSEGISPPCSDASDDKTDEPETEQMEEESAITETTIDDSAAAPKEAVTLNLESYTNSFICGEENDEFLRYYDTRPPVKTYLRKTPKRSEIPTEKEEETASETNIVDKSTELTGDEIITSPPSPAVEVETYTVGEENEEHQEVVDETAAATSTAVEKARESDEDEGEEGQEQTQGQNDEHVTDGAHVLFSRKVISLREDDCSNGGMTPSYLKVPESVEVSSQGSNVVFSMQGRRLSSFPPLKVSSPNDHDMPDFDADFFSEGEETVENNATQTSVNLTPMSAKAIIKSTESQNEKPTAKRRTVWFSDKNEVREIAPREEISTFAMQTSMASISASINNINTTKQQFLPSTSQQSSSSSLQPPDINAYKSPSTSTATTSTPAINSILLKKSMPPTTPTSPDTASLKSAQEKDPHTNDDNRTDDVLAAAEILANGIRLVQTITQPTPLCCGGGENFPIATPPSPSPPPAPAPTPTLATAPTPEPLQISPAENVFEIIENISEIQPLVEATRSELNENVGGTAEVHVPLKRKLPMMVSPTGSDGTDSVLEGFVPIRRQRIESVDEYEQFYRCHYSPNNMKRLFSDGHISLPLKKRRKLSEYSEENDFIEPYDNDTVLNLKMPRNEVPTEKPKQTATVVPKPPVVSLEKDLKEISYPSEPMLSIAHFEKDGYRDKSKDLTLKRPYPPVPPPRYSDVIRDCRPMVAHQQGLFQHPEQSQLQQSNSTAALPQSMSTRPTINIVTARHTDHFGTINIINQENGTINIVTEENRDVNASTTNVYSNAQPVNLTNVNVGYQNANNLPSFVGPNAIQYSQAFLPKQQNCMYNVQPRPPPTPTPEHIPPDFELQSIINLQNYHMNQTHINNFLHNRQINYQANKNVMNDALCGGSYQQSGGVRNCTDVAPESPSSSPNQCEGSLSRKSSLIPRCGFCMDCKRRVTGMKIQSPDLTPLHASPPQLHEESSEGPSSPPRRRGRPRKPFAEPTNRVTRSTNRAGQKKKEDPTADQFIFHVSETKSPSSAKKRRSVSSYRSK